MILDVMDNLPLYQKLMPNLEAVIAWLQKTTIHALEEGRYPICGEDAYCNVLRKALCPHKGMVAEIHRDYLDIHIALEHGEQIAFSNVETIDGWSEYDANTDARTAALKTAENVVNMRPGMMAICFPQDAHCPCLTGDDVKSVRKLVLKIRCSQYVHEKS